MGETLLRLATRPATAAVQATLVLIRHGHTLDNTPGAGARLLGWTDAPLSPLGRQQVARIRARVLRDPPVALYASPLVRARQTAAALAGALGLRPRLRAGLREIRCGEVDGLPVVDLQRRRPDLWRRNLAQDDDEFRWPGGESYREFRARCLDAVRRIAAAHAGQRIAVVTHAGVITQVLGALHDTPPARWDAFHVGNASLTVVQWSPNGGVMEVFDDRSHLHYLRAAAPAGSRLRPSAPPHGVGAAHHAQEVVGGAHGFRPAAGRSGAPAIGDEQVVA